MNEIFRKIPRPGDTWSPKLLNRLLFPQFDNTAIDQIKVLKDLTPMASGDATSRILSLDVKYLEGKGAPPPRLLLKIVRRQNIPDRLPPDLRDTSAHQGCNLSWLS